MLLTNLGAWRDNSSNIQYKSRLKRLELHRGSKGKKSKVLKRGSTQLVPIFKFQTCTTLVTWYDDITSCERFHWLHDGHVVRPHIFILYSICRTANCRTAKGWYLPACGEQPALRLGPTSECMSLQGGNFLYYE